MTTTEPTRGAGTGVGGPARAGVGAVAPGAIRPRPTGLGGRRVRGRPPSGPKLLLVARAAVGDHPRPVPSTTGDALSVALGAHLDRHPFHDGDAELVGKIAADMRFGDPRTLPRCDARGSPTSSRNRCSGVLRRRQRGDVRPPGTWSVPRIITSPVHVEERGGDRQPREPPPIVHRARAMTTRTPESRRRPCSWTTATRRARIRGSMRAVAVVNAEALPFETVPHHQELRDELDARWRRPPGAGSRRPAWRRRRRWRRPPRPGRSSRASPRSTAPRTTKPLSPRWRRSGDRPSPPAGCGTRSRRWRSPGWCSRPPAHDLGDAGGAAPSGSSAASPSSSSVRSQPRPRTSDFTFEWRYPRSSWSVRAVRPGRGRRRRGRSRIAAVSQHIDGLASVTAGVHAHRTTYRSPGMADEELQPGDAVRRPLRRASTGSGTAPPARTRGSASGAGGRSTAFETLPRARRPRRLNPPSPTSRFHPSPANLRRGINVAACVPSDPRPAPRASASGSPPARSTATGPPTRYVERVAPSNGTSSRTRGRRQAGSPELCRRCRSCL